MPYREQYYRWEWQLQASPDMLWDFVADTNRLNGDVGIPTLELRNASSPNLRRVRLDIPLLKIEWEEEPFDWVRPYRYAVVRHIKQGPLEQMRFVVELHARPDGGTHLVHQNWLRPRDVLGIMAGPLIVGLLVKRRLDMIYHRYDELAVQDATPLDLPTEHIQFAPGGYQRLEEFRKVLLARNLNPQMVGGLIDLIRTADDLTLFQLRPYIIADYWKQERKAVLELFLWATRIGLLELRWELLCPLCRGSQEAGHTLSDINPQQVHCDTCNIDFTANFDQSVELTFRVNPSVRLVKEPVFCVGSPHRTPHILMQQKLEPGEQQVLSLQLEIGRYRLRAKDIRGGYAIRVCDYGARDAIMTIHDVGWPSEELHLTPLPTIAIENATNEVQQLILERTAWSDQATTAAEVTALQVFRDLFSNEALRPGERITVGNMTVLFTDLRKSTQLYQEIGDAPAFGLVMNHFDVLKAAIAEEGGAIVKTIGDAVMAVFRRPVAAMRAAMRAQRILANPPQPVRPLLLKVGIHNGPCIAVTLNERLDYFGSTVNIAARLTSLSAGEDIVISDTMYNDPEVTAFCAAHDAVMHVQSFVTTIRGFEGEEFKLWRVVQ